MSFSRFSSSLQDYCVELMRTRRGEREEKKKDMKSKKKRKGVDRKMWLRSFHCLSFSIVRL